jgi:transcriptional regulator with XRE-family HTH domain
VSDLDFAGLLRQSRERLGLSTSRVAELIGRAPGTIRAWEKGTSRPSEPGVVSALAAVLGIDESALFDSAGLDRPVIESNPTVRQALSTIAPGAVHDEFPTREPAGGRSRREPSGAFGTFQPGVTAAATGETIAATHERASDEETQLTQVPASMGGAPSRKSVRDGAPSFLDRLRAATVRRQPRPASAPSTLPPVPRAPSYLEDTTERWSYRLRAIYTGAGVIALFIVLGWAASNFFSSVGEVWEILTRNL